MDDFGSPVGGVRVAEDNATNRFVICAMLKSLGIKPLIAEWTGPLSSGRLGMTMEASG